MYGNSDIAIFVQGRKSCLLQTTAQFKLFHKKHMFFLLFAGKFDLILDGRQNENFEFLIS